MHEELISINESQNTYDYSNSYIILPAILSKSFKKYQKSFNLKKVENFKYDSLNNDQFLTVKDLKRIIKS